MKCWLVKELPLEKAKKLAERSGITLNLEKSIPLCEIYNQEDNGNQITKQKEVGFKLNA